MMCCLCEAGPDGKYVWSYRKPVEFDLSNGAMQQVISVNEQMFYVKAVPCLANGLARTYYWPNHWLQ